VVVRSTEMFVIHKYPVNITGDYTVMPMGARILSVQVQYDKVCVWAIIDKRVTVNALRQIVPYGTGIQLPHANPGTFLGTVQLQDGHLVLHLFDCGEA
jgi:hypothetical protein